MSTNVTILKSPEYSYLWICNSNDVKFIDWSCTWSKTRNEKHTSQRQKFKTNKVVLRRRNHKNKRNKTKNMRKSFISLKVKEKKTIHMGDFKW